MGRQVGDGQMAQGMRGMGVGERLGGAQHSVGLQLVQQLPYRGHGTQLVARASLPEMGGVPLGNNNVNRNSALRGNFRRSKAIIRFFIMLANPKFFLFFQGPAITSVRVLRD